MAATTSCEVHQTSDYDRKIELEAFDGSKSGIKGLVDAGLVKIPRIFVHDQPVTNQKSKLQLKMPIIDLKFIGEESDESTKGQIIADVKSACEKWGFIQVTNHGIPTEVLEEMIKGVRDFHELETEVKKKYYSRDPSKQFVYYSSNFHLHNTPALSWSDAVLTVMAPNPPDPKEVPSVYRDRLTEYSKHVMRLGHTILELLSEALGLESCHLKNMGCAEGLFFIGSYYPACPEPELTIGKTAHSDSGFFTILLQDSLGGLQVLHDKDWVDVPPVPGALIVNIADLLQLLSNDKFKSVGHRVLAPKIGPRVSIAAFFRIFTREGAKPSLYGPIQELLSEENRPVYRETGLKEFRALRNNGGVDGTSSLYPFRVQGISKNED